LWGYRGMVSIWVNGWVNNSDEQIIFDLDGQDWSSDNLCNLC
jgi:hypothetical protein